MGQVHFILPAVRPNGEEPTRDAVQRQLQYSGVLEAARASEPPLRQVLIDGIAVKDRNEAESSRNATGTGAARDAARGGDTHAQIGWRPFPAGTAPIQSSAGDKGHGLLAALDQLIATPIWEYPQRRNRVEVNLKMTIENRVGGSGP